MKPKRLKKKGTNPMTIAEHMRQRPERKPLPQDLPGCLAKWEWQN